MRMSRWIVDEEARDDRNANAKRPALNCDQSRIRLQSQRSSAPRR
jgi:hypothetical protein